MYKYGDRVSECSGQYLKNNRWMWMNIVEVKRSVSQEKGHATEAIQLKVYRPFRPSISASVNEKFCHVENK